MRPRVPRLVLLAAPIAFAAACEIRDDERPRISILTPADGSTNDSSSVLVTVDIDRFTLDPTVYPIDDQTQSEAFKGHWHLYLDRFFVDCEFTTTALLTNIDPGEHEIAAELVNQNHQYIHGTPIAFSYVTVPASAPGIYFDEPDDGDTNASSSIDVSVTLENLVIDTNLAAQNQPGHGHIHYAVDGGPALDAFSAAFTVTDIAGAGEPAAAELPVLTVEFVQNDHSSFSTPVLDQSQVVVPSDAPRVSILAPADAATVGTSLQLSFALANLDLVDFTTAVSETNGQGHYHVLVDGVEVLDDWASTPPAILLTPGDHEVRFELRSNQHDPLTPGCVDILRVTSAP